MNVSINKHDVTHRPGGLLIALCWVSLFSLVAGMYFFVEARWRDSAAVVTGGEMGRTIVNLGLESRIVADRQGVIVACSPTAAEIAGYTAAELIGKPAYVLMPDDYKKRHRESFEKAMATNVYPAQVNIVRCNLLKKDGTIRPVEVIVRIIDGPNEWGGKIAVVTITPVELIKFTPVDKPAAEARKDNMEMPE